ncbi:hypothetical protein Bca52824_027515 [Brassica carinata]|uniref:DC1 domain-containing protein n=1 Tax=Brassica carinata TaxID=52824 RepID=A0A8X8AQC7_BRACI|nr:hypothetical protein Bca52824_027515 [Brassica carinata]
MITHSFHPQHPLWLFKSETLPDHQNGCMCCSLGGEELMLVVDQHKLHLLMKNVSFAYDACGFESKVIDLLIFSDVSKRCQACKLPVVYNPYFCCYKGCEFFLDESCANLPRRKISYKKKNLRLQYLWVSFLMGSSIHNLDVLQSLCPSKHQFMIHEHLLTIKSDDLQICSVCKFWASPILSCATCGFYTCKEDYCFSLHFSHSLCNRCFTFEVKTVLQATLLHMLECKGLEVIMSKVGGGDKYLCSCSCLMRNRQSSKEFVIHR